MLKNILKNDVKKERIETLKLDTPVFENKVNVKSIFFKANLDLKKRFNLL